MRSRLLIILSLFFSVAASSQDIEMILKSLKTDKQVADTLFYYGRRLMMRGKNDSAMYWIDRGLETAHRMKDGEWIARFYVEKSNVLLNGDKKKTLDELKKADPYMDHVKDYKVWQKYYILTAKCYKHLLKHDFALEYFLRAEKLNQENNPYQNWLVYLELGEMFNDADAVDEAKKYYEKAYSLTKLKGVRMDHGLMISSMAEFYSKRKMPEQFATVFKEYEAFIASGKKPNSDPLHNMLFVDWGQTVLEEKVSFMEKVRENLLKNGDYINAGYANAQISGFYETNGNLEKALTYMQKNIDLSYQDQNLHTLYLYSNVYYRLLKKAGHNERAVVMADKLFALKDSIIKAQQRDIVLEMETKYQTEQKEKEIALLNSTAELSKKEIDLLNSQNSIAKIQLQREEEQRQALLRENMLQDSVLQQGVLNNDLLRRENDLKNSELLKGHALTASLNREKDLKAGQLTKEKKFRGLLLAGAALLLAAGFFILMLYGKQKRKSRLIQKQSNDLQVLLKEIHHRVKNNLQVISSLLDLQSLSITDNQASEAVKEGKNRVQSMALIHQNLYTEDNLKGIKAKAYIDNLLVSLCDSYNISTEKVKLTSDIDDLNLDVDTMIPLGLILNELVSNSLKHAFREGRPGELNIVLKEEGGRLLLRVSDNGAGYPETVNAKEGKSFGMKMIRAFAQKLKAKLEIYNNNGAVVEMQISKYNLA